MLRSLYSSVSGLRVHQTRMDVIGNNIANVNTLGFKSSRMTFKEAYAQTLQGSTRPVGDLGGINPFQVGLGVSSGSIDTRYTQGNLQSTGKITDLAIEGEGMFIVGNGDDRMYTRSGNMQIDSQGRLVSPMNGYTFLGLMANDEGIIPSSGTLTPITLPIGVKVPANATTEIAFRCNLGAEMTTSTASLDDAGTTGITSVSGMASDGVGGRHTITITGANATRSVNTGTNAAAIVLTGVERLGADLGVTDVTDFRVNVDGQVTTIQGLTLTSSVNDLINAINSQTDGVTAELVAGQIRITRERAGVGTTNYVTLSDINGCDITSRVFGAATFNANNGTASTLVATDTFVANHGGYTYVRNLDIVLDDLTGLADEITGVGDDGITVIANNGLSAGTSIIDTADSVHSANIDVYDEQGTRHNVVFNFYRSPTDNRWFWEAVPESPATIANGGSGEITFNGDGSIGSFAYAGGATSMILNPNNGATTPVSISLNPGTFGQFNGITQFATPSTTVAYSQDGYTMGILKDITVSRTGVISGYFSNGVTRQIGQMALAQFANPGGLERDGNSLFRESTNSGLAIVGYAGATFTDVIMPGSLEMSNVDLSEEFTEMIITQRGFQANARVISTSDEMLTELVNLRR